MIVNKKVIISSVELDDHELSTLYEAANILSDVCGVYDTCGSCPLQPMCNGIDPADIVSTCAQILEGKA